MSTLKPSHPMTTLDSKTLDELAEKIIQRLQPSLRKTIREEIRWQLPTSSEQNNPDTLFFKSLTEELMGKISAIYQEIHNLQSPNPKHNPDSHEQAEEAADLVMDASQKLNQIITQTEKATFDILDRVDRSMENMEQIQAALDSDMKDENQKQAARALTATINDDLMAITTDLSFQDLTGQRIKRVIEMLQKVEEMAANIYISAGIILKNKERTPEKNLQETKMDIQKTVSQNDVDAMLEQLNSL